MVNPNFSEVRLEDALGRHRSGWWILGNEPNDPNQDDLSPGAYAAFYHRAEGLIRRADPKAHVTPAGISNADWRWAEAFRESYREQYGRYPRVDAWNIHDYVLEPDRDQLDVAEFQRRIIAFHTWMEESGEGDKPLLLTEFGALFGPDQPASGFGRRTMCKAIAGSPISPRDSSVVICTTSRGASPSVARRIGEPMGGLRPRQQFRRTIEANRGELVQSAGVARQ